MKFKVYYQKNKKLCSIVLEAEDIYSLTKLDEFPLNVVQIKHYDYKKVLNYEIEIFKDHKKLLFETFKQISIMLEANLSFHKSIELLLQTKQDKTIQKILTDIKHAINKSQPIEKVLNKHRKYLDDTTILFIKLGLEKGNIKESVSSLVTILEQDIKTTKKLKDTMRYPVILLTSVFIVLWMIFLFVVPNFEFIFSSLNSELPTTTKALLAVKDILNDHWYGVVLFFILLIFSLYLLYKKYGLEFDRFILLKVPVLSKTIQSYSYYKLFLSVYIIIRSKYQFQTAIQNSKSVVQNRFLQSKINMIITKINKGKEIVKAFEESKLFDEVTIQLLYTAQHTNNYEDVLKDITNLYKKRFQDSVENFSSFINPILIFTIALFVLWIILAVMEPMWSVSSSL